MDNTVDKKKYLPLQREYKIVYSGANYEWLWPRDMDLNYSKCHVQYNKSLRKFLELWNKRKP